MSPNDNHDLLQALNSLFNAIPHVFAFLTAVFAWYVNRKLKEISKVVNGPLTAEIKRNVELTKKIADATNMPEDVKEAAAAQAVEEHHEAGVAARTTSPPL